MAAYSPKEQIRREARARRDAIPPESRVEASRAIVRHILEAPELRDARIIAAYLTLGSEVQTELLLDEVLRLMGGVALPRVDPASDRIEFQWVESLGPRSVKPGALGIREPVKAVDSRMLSADEIDLFLIPGLAFDRHGYRLGMGGGHYDRYLTQVRNAPKWGMCFEVQLLESLPHEAHDVRMDRLITESGMIRCPRA